MARKKRRPGRKGKRMDFLVIVGDITDKIPPMRFPVRPKPKRRAPPSIIKVPRPVKIGRPKGREVLGKKGFLGIKGLEFKDPSPRKGILRWLDFEEYTRGFKELTLFGKRTGEFMAKDVISSATLPEKATESQRVIAKGYQSFIGSWLSHTLGLNKKKRRK